MKSPISIHSPVPTNLQVTDDAGKQLILVSNDGTTVFDWPAIRAFLEAADRDKPTVTSFVVQAVHAAYLEGIEKGKQRMSAQFCGVCL